MRTVLLASLRTHGRRYVAAVLAVVTGVAFVVVTGVLGAATRAGLTAGVGLPYASADTVVTDLTGDQADALVRANPGGTSVLGWAVLPVDDGGRRLTDRAEVGALAGDPALRWQTLTEGRYPRRAGKTVVDAVAARSRRVAVGDVLAIGSGARRVRATVVGLVDSPAVTVGASLYLTWTDLAPYARSFRVDSLAWTGSPDPRSVTPGVTVSSPDSFVRERQTAINRGVDVVALVLLLFAAVALFVSVLVIANTFSILLAQRTRDFALLRCVGATRRQVLRSVRLEALCLGVAASLTGVGAGVAVGHGVVALVHRFAPAASLGAASVSPRWLAGALTTGVVATVVASWLPTRRVTRTGPLAALRPDATVDLRTAAGRVRVALGAVLVVLGGALLAVAVASTTAGVMVVGGGAAFTGLVLLGPLVVPALIRTVGRALPGPAARLAVGNAVRNPRRTAATTASLLVGVTLTTAVLAGLASSRGAVDTEMARDHPLDVALTSTTTGLPADTVDRVRAVPGVAAAVGLAGTTARIGSGAGERPLLAAPAAAGVARGRTPAAGDGEVLLPYDALPEPPPARVRVVVGDHGLVLRVVRGQGWGDAALVSPATLARLTPRPVLRAVWVRAQDGADLRALGGDLEASVGDAAVDTTNGLADRAWVDRQLDVLTGAVVTLLGVAVLIALVGIGNTLGLSVLERARENSLLRALGLTRRQLRSTLAIEALLLSGAATVLGGAVGLVFAWVGVQTMVRPVVDAPLVLPWGSLALVGLVAGAAGLLACVLPARRAVRTAPAAGLLLD